MKNPNFKYALFLVIAIIALGSLLVVKFDRPSGARGKSPARPATGDLPPEALLAQDLALSDPGVIALTTGRRSEVFGVVETGDQYTEASSTCARADCRQVDIYNFDENVLITAIVDVDGRRVLDVLEMPGQLPAGNDRLREVAIQAIMNAPEVEAQLGWVPTREDIYLNPSGLVGSDCGSIHPCLGAIFPIGERFLWAHVDLTTESFAGISWSEAADEEGTTVEFVPDGGCPDPGEVVRDGWDMDYSVTSTDGLRLSDVTYNGFQVMANAKLVEWHVGYSGGGGFIDATGCGSGGGQFSIDPYGDTLVLDLLDEGQNVIGFEVVQDFRMSSWGFLCNYRYEQHFQFFQDGRFRVVGGAFGKGCGIDGTYRPVIRIDLAVGGDSSDRFASWNGTSFADDLVEFWASQSGVVTPEGYAWRVADTVLDLGYHIEPGQGQFDDGGLGDNAFIYITAHHANEGNADMSAIGSCCNTNYQQGPHNYLNGESIDGENIVMWYVPQFVTDADPGQEYCWTISGEPNPETYPCFGGPMFHPFGFDGPTPTPSATATATATATPTATATATPPPPPNTWIYLPVILREP